MLPLATPIQHDRINSPRAPLRPGRYVLEAVLLWLAIGGGLLYIYHLVDGSWLAHLPVEKREVARWARSVAISITATVVTAVYVLWRGVPALRQTLSDDQPVLTVTENLGDWLFGLRWVALLVLAPVVVLSTTGGLVPRSSVLPLWGGLACLFVVNAVLLLSGRRVRATPRAFVAGVLLDTLLLGWLLHHAAGVANPFAMIFAFHAVIAGIVLRPRLARAVIATIAAVVLMLTVFEATGLWPAACIAGLDRVCHPPEPFQVMASGVAVATLVAGCGLFVVALTGAVHRERTLLDTARRQLAEERENLRSIIDCMADGVIFSDPEGRILLLNHAALALWADGPPATRSLGVCHNRSTWDRLLERLANAGEHEEHPLLRVRDRSYEATYARVLDEHGGLRGVVMVARDVTDRLQSQQWRMREERMAVVGKLAAALAHELNNPLGSIALFTQHAIKKVPDGDPLMEHLQTVLRNANLCSKHVRDLLSYARQRPPERTTFDPRELFSDVQRTLTPQAERSGVRIIVAPGADAPHDMFGDADQLRQVLMNLGINAIEAMPQGGNLKIDLRSDGDGGARFEVSDTGPGIAAEQLPEIFSPFHTTKPEGTGLGLAVASDIVRAHGGRLEVQSTPGRGTTFVARFPLAQPSIAREAVQ